MFNSKFLIPIVTHTHSNKILIKPSYILKIFLIFNIIKSRGYDMKLRAFTLAEVLITLGIIGIVASMTMPVLIQKHRRSVVEVSLKNFYTTMNQAILRSVVDNGEVKYWTFAEAGSWQSYEAFYNRYLKNYLKTLKADVSSVGSLANLFTLVFPDGSAAAIGYLGHNWYYCIKAKDLSHFADKRGTGCFMFGFYPTLGGSAYSAKNFRNKTFEPYVNYVAEDENGVMKDDEGNTILTDETMLYQQKCYAKAIQLNGWKIPDDYPLKF